MAFYDMQNVSVTKMDPVLQLLTECNRHVSYHYPYPALDQQFPYGCRIILSKMVSRAFLPPTQIQSEIQGTVPQYSHSMSIFLYIPNFLVKHHSASWKWDIRRRGDVK